MNSLRNCGEPNCKDNHGNCLIPRHDGLPIQCVGYWVKDKYFFLERYLNASCEARRKFSEKGNAVFIDLFAGPGKCIIKNTKKEIDSGGMMASKRDKVPFNEYFYFDIHPGNAEALKKRLNENKEQNYQVICEDSNVWVYKLVETLLKKPYRYHFAFIDPFGPRGLKFDTIRELAKLDRMDMLIHFPIGAIKRNLKTWIEKKDTILDNFLGTETWHKEIIGSPEKEEVKILIDIFKQQLKAIGYPEEGLKLISSDNNYNGLPTVSVKNTKEVDLYFLILAAKHKLAQKIWNSIITTNRGGQKALKF